MRRNLGRWTIRISAILLAGLPALFCMVELMIGLGVRRCSHIAQERYPGDRVKALISMVDCESCNLRDRDHAVWALGQLADHRALPVLEKHYTGKKCDHLHGICQYELEKALKLVRSGRNSEALFWKWVLPNHG
jgi:hypothetical protein